MCENLLITITPCAGANIYRALNDAINLARLTRRHYSMKFNDVEFLIKETSDIDELIRFYYKKIN